MSGRTFALWLLFAPVAVVLALGAMVLYALGAFPEDAEGDL